MKPQPLTSEQQAQVDEFVQLMKEKIIPEIADIMYRRQVAAAKSRHKILR